MNIYSFTIKSNFFNSQIFTNSDAVFGRFMGINDLNLHIFDALGFELSKGAYKLEQDVAWIL